MRHRGQFGRDRLGIVARQRYPVAKTVAHSARVVPSRLNRDEIAAKGFDLVFDALTGPLADRHHGDHRAHADDHAQHRQRGAHLVREQCLECDLERSRQILHMARA